MFVRSGVTGGCVTALEFLLCSYFDLTVDIFTNYKPILKICSAIRDFKCVLDLVNIPIGVHND